MGVAENYSGWGGMQVENLVTEYSREKVSVTDETKFRLGERSDA